MFYIKSFSNSLKVLQHATGHVTIFYNSELRKCGQDGCKKEVIKNKRSELRVVDGNGIDEMHTCRVGEFGVYIKFHQEVLVSKTFRYAIRITSLIL